MAHRVGQIWVKDFDDGCVELRVCLDPDESKYMSLTDGGTWVWKLRERVPQPYDGWYGDFWCGWEDMT